MSHTEFRALKESARTLQIPSDPKDSVAQEDGNGNEKGPDQGKDKGNHQEDSAKR